MKSGLSDLENDLELEFGAISSTERIGELEVEDELEDGDQEFEEDEFEADDESEFEVDDEFEETDQEFEGVDEAGGYVERFMELAGRSYESETELDGAVNNLIGEMEREYFLKAVWRKAKKAGGSLLKRRGLGALMSLAKRFAGGHPLFKALSSLTSLAKGDLSGLLKQLAKAAISAHPVGGTILGAMNALGMKPPVVGEAMQDREAWDNFVGMSREAYGSLANSLDETTPTLAGARRQATRAFTSAVRSRSMRTGGRTSGRFKGRTRKIVLRPGERLVVYRSK